MGAIINIGKTDVREVERVVEYDLEYGYQTTVIFEGEQEALNAYLATRYVGFKWAVRPFKGPAYRGTLILGNAVVKDPNIQDTWERDVEFIHEDMRRNPKIQALFSNNLQDLTRAYKQAKAEINKTSSTRPSGNAGILYDLLASGEEGHEIERITLMRRRSIPLFYTGARQPTASALIYTTASFVSAFQVPAYVQTILPATPSSAPANTVWSWKVRADKSHLIPSFRKTEEVMAWTFAAWSTRQYTLV